MTARITAHAPDPPTGPAPHAPLAGAMDRAAFYAALRESPAVFGRRLGEGEVAGMEGILDAMQAVGDGREQTLAYALATAYHETGRRMVPVREGFARSDAAAVRAVAGLAAKRGPRSAPARYGRPAGPHGHVYYGRGHVQLTWLRNYERSSPDAGRDLVAEPDAMLDPVVSARVLIRGLVDGRWNGRGLGLAAYLPDEGACDLRGARRTVNGTDRWKQVASYHEAFLGAVRAAGGVAAPRVGGDPVAVPPPTAAPRPQTSPAQTSPAQTSPAQVSPAQTSPAKAQAAAELAAWAAECPGDPRAVGAWLSRLPERARGADVT